MNEPANAPAPVQAPAPTSKKSSLGKKIGGVLLVLVALVALLAGFVAIQPEDFRIVRATTISAPTEKVFDQVNDFHNWEAWSPWAKLDPQAKNTFEGPSSGKGAIFKWSGNSEVGEGKMTLTESRPPELVAIKLEFIRPFAATNDVEFTFHPASGDTIVTWSMSGKNNFMGKAMCLVMNMDKTVGGDFEKGLASMKAIVERK
jgi:hypothetical protein